MLSSVGWRCDTASNGTEALRLLSIPVDSGGNQLVVPQTPSGRCAAGPKMHQPSHSLCVRVLIGSVRCAAHSTLV